MFLGKGVLNKYSKFTGEHPCRRAISIKFQSNFIEIILWHTSAFVACFQNTFLKNTSGGLLLFTANFFRGEHEVKFYKRAVKASTKCLETHMILLLKFNFRNLANFEKI